MTAERSASNRFSSRVVSRERLISLVQAARENGSSIVLANGCFDVLHVGHVRYLVGARALGDLLVVGVNSDQQVAIQKGGGPPLMRAVERPETMASREAAAYVRAS